MAVKIDGKMVSAQIKANLAERVAALKEQGVNPGLGTILVGSDAGSVKYVAGKHADCAEIGVNSIKKELPADATFEQIAEVVQELNADPAFSPRICSTICSGERPSSTRTPSSI